MLMKKALTTFAMAAVVAVSAGTLFSSCNAVKDAVPSQTVSFDGASADVVIPPTSDTTAKGNLATATFRYNIDSLIKDKTGGALGAGNIKSVKIASVSLSISDIDQNNSFANFQYASFTFNTDVTPGSSPYDVASIDNNPNVYAATLDLPLQSPNTDVKQYFGNNAQFTYALIAKLRRAITKSLHCHIDIKYNIEVKG